MENRNMESRMKDLIDDFVDEKGDGFCESVYEKLYAHLADSFCESVSEHCKVIVFGNEYSLSARELYDFDRCLANEAWNDHVGQFFDDFRALVNEVISDELDEFTEEFQQWLASQDDECASDAIVALMSGAVDLTEIVTDWLYDRLGNASWGYPS